MYTLLCYSIGIFTALIDTSGLISRAIRWLLISRDTASALDPKHLPAGQFTILNIENSKVSVDMKSDPKRSTEDKKNNTKPETRSNSSNVPVTETCRKDLRSITPVYVMTTFFFNVTDHRDSTSSCCAIIAVKRQVVALKIANVGKPRKSDPPFPPKPDSYELAK